MHGTVMIFLAVVPLATGAFGNYLVPLQIGARGMAFPRLNVAGYWIYLVAGLLMIGELLRCRAAPPTPAGRRIRRWRSSRRRARRGGWSASSCSASSAMLGAVNLIATVVQLRAPGLTLLAAAVLRLGAAGDRAAAAARLSGAAGRRRLPADGPRRGHQLLPADRPGRERHAAAGRRRRRQPAAVAAPVLVPGASRGLRAGPAGDRHRGRGDHRATRAGRCGATG